MCCEAISVISTSTGLLENPTEKMKTSTRLFSVLVLSILILPQVTFAAWWNPFTWWSTPKPVPQAQPVQVATTTQSTSSTTASTQNKNISPKPKPKISTVIITAPKQPATPVVVPVPIPILQVQPQAVITPLPVTSWSDLETKYFADATQKNWVSLTITNANGEKHYYRYENGKWVRKDTLAEAQEAYQPAPPLNTTICNGTYWTQCPAGQTLYCPVTGGATCQSPQQPTSVLPIYVPVYQTPPPMPIYTGPTVAQQKVQCQQQHDTSVQSINLFIQNQSAYYNKMISDGQTFFNQCGANGRCASGMANQAQAEIDAGKAGITDTQTSYTSQLASTDSLLQQCLDAAH